MKIDLKVIIIALLVLVILYLGMCRTKPVPELPPVKPVTEQKAEVIHDEDSINAIIDTLIVELQNKDEQLAEVNDALYDGQKARRILQAENAALRAKLTAGELTDNINDNADKLNDQIKKNDSLCNTTIILLNKKVSIKDKVISQKNNLYKKLKSNFDTCLKNQSSLERYSKQIKPLRELTIAAKVITNYVFPLKLNAGVEVGYRNKKGTEYIVGYYTNQQVSVGVKKTLFKF
jgi:chromosome condensin MukBEF ATPase and DNA-binding subunit MukB